MRELFNIISAKPEEGSPVSRFFDAVERDALVAPMYDAAVALGTDIYKKKLPNCNDINNSHSVTKFFIAAAVGRLCDEGRISLDDKVTSFFASFPPDGNERWKNVSVYSTLRHMTGLGEDSIKCGVDAENSNEVIGEDFLSDTFRLPLPYEPEQYRRYSDAAYYLLGRIVSAASGMNARDYLNEEFFKPICFSQWAMACCPMGYPIGGGGLFARAADIVKLGVVYARGGELFGRRYVSKEWIDMSKSSDFALSRFRDSDIWVKTGAHGQIVAFTDKRDSAVAWHGCASEDDHGKRNDRLLEAYLALLDEVRPK